MIVLHFQILRWVSVCVCVCVFVCVAVVRFNVDPHPSTRMKHLLPPGGGQKGCDRCPFVVGPSSELR